MGYEIKFFPEFRHLSSDGKSMIIFDVKSSSLIEVDYATAAVLEELCMCQDDSDFRLASSSYLRSLGFEEAVISDAVSQVDKLVELGAVTKTAPEESDIISITSILFNVSQSCQLQCAYCFASEGNFSDEHLVEQPLMDVETGHRAVDFFFEIANQEAPSYTIIFFGGEPLLNWELITILTEYAEEKCKIAGKSISFGITSNGVLLDEAKIQYMEEHNINCMISMDGDEAIHNNLRPHKLATENSYDLAKKAIALQASLRNYANVRATVTSLSTDYFRLEQALLEAGASKVNLQLISSPPNDPLVLSHDQLREFSYASRNRVFMGDLKRSHVHDTNLARVINGARQLCFCGFAEKSMGIDGLGRVYACHRVISNEDYLVGDIFSGIDKTHLLDIRKKISVHSRIGCRSCWIRYLCGGGCPADCLVDMDGVIYGQGSQFCYHYKVLFEALIEYHLQKLKELNDSKNATREAATS